MVEQQSEKSGRRVDAVRFRLALASLLACLLIYGCWQSIAWFVASFPRDFR